MTIDHEEIKAWVEGRGGFPAHVKRGSSKDDRGILRIDFPGFSGEGSLERVELGPVVRGLRGERAGLPASARDRRRGGEPVQQALSRNSEQAMEIAQKSGQAKGGKQAAKKS